MYTPVNGTYVPDLMASKYSFIIIIIIHNEDILAINSQTKKCSVVPNETIRTRYSRTEMD